MSNASLAARVVVLGPQCSGRTRLVHALTPDHKAPSTPSTTDSTFGLLVRSTDSVDDDSNRLKVLVWDFEGPTAFDAAYGLFLSAQTLFVVTVDLHVYAAKYKPTLDAHDLNASAVLDEYVHGHVVYWIRFIVTRFSNARIVVVGTKADLVDDKALQDVEKDLEERLSRWKRALQDEVELHGRPSEWPHPIPSPTKNEQLNVLRRLEQQRVWLDKQDRLTWTTASSLSVKSVDKLRVTLIGAIKTAQLQQSIPMKALNELELYREKPNEEIDIVSRQDLRLSIPSGAWDTLVCLGELIPLEDNGFVVFRYQALVVLVKELLDYVATDKENELSEDGSFVKSRFRNWKWKKESDEKHRNQAKRVVHVPPGMVTHSDLVGIQSWKSIQRGDLVSTIKAFMQSRRFAFLSKGKALADASIIVPTKWRLDDQKQKDLSARYAPLAELIQLSPDISTSLHKASWEYEFNTQYLPRTFFEEAAVQCYGHNIQLQVHENDLLGGIVDQSIFRIAVFFHRGGRMRHMIRVEVMAVTSALCAALLKWCCNVVETSIEEHDGLSPERFEIDERNGESTPVIKQSNINVEWEEYPSLETQPSLGVPSPLTLCLDVRSIREFEKIKWKKRYLEWELVNNLNGNGNTRKKTMSYRRAPIMLDENNRPQWSTYSIRLTPAPAIKNMKDWCVQVTLRRNSVLCFGHIARGYLPLDALSVSEDLSTFTAANVELPFKSRTKRDIGVMVCHVSPGAKETKA